MLDEILLRLDCDIPLVLLALLAMLKQVDELPTRKAVRVLPGQLKIRLRLAWIVRKPRDGTYDQDT